MRIIPQLSFEVREEEGHQALQIGLRAFAKF